MNTKPLMPCLRWFKPKPKPDPTDAREKIFVDAIVAMRDFCRSVEEGTISSRRTYARFKKILERYDAL